MSPACFYVREAIPSDVKFAQQAADNFNKAYMTQDGWTTEASIVGGKPATREDYEGFILGSGKEAIQVFVFERDEEGNDVNVAGNLSIVPFPDLNEDPTPGEAMVTRFSINPKYQSKGLGRLLIDSSLEIMKVSGYERCSLRVFENRPEMLRWYSKLGFKDTLERRDFKVPEGKKLLLNVKFVVMKKDLL